MPYENVTHNGRTRSRYIPEGSTRIKHKDGLGVVFVTQWPRRVVILAYSANASKPAFHESWRTMEGAAKRIRDYFQNLTDHARIVRESRTAGDAHTLKPGDIIRNSWGYDQTNVDWYRVARASAHYVWLQPICAHVTETGNMSGDSAPSIDTSSPDPSEWGFSDAKGDLEKHRATMWNGEPSVTFKYGSGRKWNGEAVYCSWYH